MNTTPPVNTSIPVAVNHSSLPAIAANVGERRQSLARHDVRGGMFQGWGPRL